jgi:hypothetical protein
MFFIFIIFAGEFRKKQSLELSKIIADKGYKILYG